MDIVVIIKQMIMLFLIMSIGYIGFKTKIISKDGSKTLSKLLLNVTAPSLVLASTFGGNVVFSGKTMISFTLMSAVVYIVSFIIGWIAPRIMKTPKTDVGVYEFMVTFANVGFMGYPVIMGIYGQAAGFFVSLFCIWFNILIYSVGVLLLSAKKEKAGWSNLKVLINPVLVAVIISIIVMVARIKVPSVIFDVVNMVGNVTTPLAMILVGSILGSLPVKELFNEWRVYIASTIRLIAAPILTWLVLRLIISDDLILGILTILSAMPAATNSTLMTMEYGGNEKIASKGVFISTLASVVTLPLIIYLLLM